MLYSEPDKTPSGTHCMRSVNDAQKYHRKTAEWKLVAPEYMGKMLVKVLKSK